MSERDQVYADVAWVIGDIRSRWRCTKEEAHAFLAEHEQRLRDFMIEKGWAFLSITVPFAAKPMDGWDDGCDDDDNDEGDEDEDEGDEVTDDHEMEGR